jgi:radical SAM protein with 4Fe4S-binding SPASM domain
MNKLSPEPPLEKLPQIFILELTRRCNNRCLYCYGFWGGHSNSGDVCESPKEMTTDEIKEVIAKLHDETNLASIGLTGGEPFIRDDLAEIVSFIKDRNIYPVIITNGTLLSEERVAKIAEGAAVQITLLSYRNEIHDKLAGRIGAWNEVITGMTNVRRAGGNLTAVFVATKLNYMDLKNTAELAIALGANGLMYNRINLGAHNIQYAGQLMPNADMIKENLDSLEEIGEAYGIPIVASVVIEPCVVDIKGYKHVRFAWCPLAGEGSYFTIDPSGNIRICNHSPTILGNIKKDSFSDIYSNHPYVREFRKALPIECNNCNHELRDFCQGGCKASAEQCYGTLTRVDPFVTLNKEST